MWCRLPASCVSSRFASFLVCIWTRVLGRRRLKRFSLLGLSTSPLPRAHADLLVVQETPKTHPKRLSLLGLSTSPSWPATIQFCGFSIPRSRAQPTGQWGRTSVDCMLGIVEGFAFGKVGFAFYLTDRVGPSNIIRKPTSNCSTEPDIWSPNNGFMDSCLDRHLPPKNQPSNNEGSWAFKAVSNAGLGGTSVWDMVVGGGGMEPQLRTIVPVCGGFLSHRGTPSHHSFSWDFPL